MKNVQSTNENIPIIFTPGLNQLYFVNFDFLNYPELSKEVIKIIKNKNILPNFENKIQKLDKEFKDNKINLFSDYKSLFLTENNIDFSKLLELLKEFINNISFMHKNQLGFIKSIKGNIYNENPFYLLIDEICLSKFQKENNIIFNYFTMRELISTDKIKNLLLNNKIFLYSYQPSHLIVFKRKFEKNLFTFLLNTYLFCFKDKIIDTEEYKKVSEIMKYFEVEKQNNNIYNKSLYIINSDINFIAINIFSYNFIYNTINVKNIDSYESLINYFEIAQPKVVLIFARFLTRKQNFVKQRYFISDESLIYKPHYGGYNKASNGKVDIVLAKSYELKDFVEYKQIFDFLENNYNMANDIHEFKYFIDKNLQNKFLNNFSNLVNKSPTLNLNSSQNKYKLFTINSITQDINQFKNKNDLITILEKNKIDFPIILKYTSNNPEFKHQVSVILNKNYLDNFINNYILKKINEKYTTTILIQHITNHGGYILKIYHMGNKNYIDYRSSLIDIDIDENNKELINDLFKNEGFWNFKTIMLESDEYKNNIWNKYTKKNEIENKVNNNKDLIEYINNVINLFEIYSHMELFGIDIIIENDKLFIIDANSLPGYKKGFNVEEDLRNYLKGIIS